jgi:hypothetical protein
MTEEQKREREEIRTTGKEYLRKRLAGEDPANDSSAWSRRAAKGMDVFRDTIRDVMWSMDSGRMSAESARELIGIAGRGIDAFVELDGGDS